MAGSKLLFAGYFNLDLLQLQFVTPTKIAQDRGLFCFSHIVNKILSMELI